MRHPLLTGASRIHGSRLLRIPSPAAGSQRRLDAPSEVRSRSGQSWRRWSWTPTEDKGRTTMQHLRFATYRINNGTFQEIADAAKSGMLPKFQEQPGFVRYGVADLGDKTCASISVWETREQAEAASPVAATWIGEHLPNRIELRENSVGDLAF